MEHTRNKYRALIISALLILGIVISMIYAVAISKIEKSHYETVRESIIETKKSFLKDTVNNVILDIEQKQDAQVQYYDHLASDIKGSLTNLSFSTKKVFFNSSIELFNKTEDFSAFIIERQTEKILYLSPSIHHDNNFLSADEIQAIKAASPIFYQFEYEEYCIIYYVSKEVIDDQVKAQIHNEVHNYKFSNNAYVWVNEVIDYNGGDHYAIRRIHPNLQETEGIYLSTNMTDIMGNYPYLTELEGVKQDGELFFNYFFKKKNSDIISEKITYAKLYKDYDWIIAMGVHLDDITAYIDQATIQNKQNVKNIVMTVAIITIFLIGIVLIFVSLLEKWYFKNTSKVLNDEIYKDSLTGAYNRRGAENHLKSAFSNYKSTEQNAAVIMFDIDDFKKINDMCGHDKGDHVLKQAVEILNQNIRSTDYLCRWGGDEFLILCSGLKEENAATFANKLLQIVFEPEFECLDGNIKRHITISMGISYFTSADIDFLDSVKRADQALYCSKAKGKNCVSVQW